MASPRQSPSASDQGKGGQSSPGPSPALGNSGSPIASPALLRLEAPGIEATPISKISPPTSSHLDVDLGPAESYDPMDHLNFSNLEGDENLLGDVEGGEEAGSKSPIIVVEDSGSEKEDKDGESERTESEGGSSDGSSSSSSDSEEGSDEASSQEGKGKGMAKEWAIDKVRNTATVLGMEINMILFQIPRTVHLRIIEEGETFSNPPAGWVGMSRVMLRLGVRLPLQPFIRKFLRMVGLAPIQLVPNV